MLEKEHSHFIETNPFENAQQLTDMQLARDLYDTLNREHHTDRRYKDGIPQAAWCATSRCRGALAVVP